MRVWILNALLLSLLFFLSLGEISRAEISMGGTGVSPKDPISKTTVMILSDLGQCTGSIIADDLVITAAHCASTNISITFKANAENVDGASISISQENVVLNSDVDIALLYFKNGLPAGYKKAQILPKNFELKLGQDVTVAGFGQTSVENTSIDGVLRKSLHEKVIRALKDGGEIEIQDRPGTGSCHGDSGGPAFVQAANGELLLWGVDNRVADDSKLECGDKEIYANLSFYQDWIQSQAERLRSGFPF